MIKLIKDITLESFKRGLLDEFLYEGSLKEPAKLDDARKIELRFESDIEGISQIRDILNVTSSLPLDQSEFNSSMLYGNTTVTIIFVF